MSGIILRVITQKFESKPVCSRSLSVILAHVCVWLLVLGTGTLLKDSALLSTRTKTLSSTLIEFHC